MKKTFLFLMMTLLLCIGSSAFNDVKAQEFNITYGEGDAAFTLTYTPLDGTTCSVKCTAGNGPSAPTEITIPQTINNGTSTYTVTTIPNSGFDGAKAALNGSEDHFTKLVLPNSIISIGEYAFYGWAGLTELHLGTSVNTTILNIAKNAFNETSNITSIYCYYTTPPTTNISSSFNSTVKNNATVYIPEKIYNNYINIYNAGEYINWNTFKKIVKYTTDPITLIPSPDYITTCDTVKFKVMQGEGTGTTDVTESATIYQVVNESETIEHDGDGYTFTPSEAGEYTFYAKNGSVQSENITIEVTEAPYVLEASTTNILANGNDETSFSVTQCDKEVEGFTFYVNGEENGDTFATAELGEYTVYGMNGTIKTNEITIYATEWKVTGKVYDAICKIINDDYSDVIGIHPNMNVSNVVEITNGVFTLWIALTGSNYDNGIILNNNVYSYETETGQDAYMERYGHRPTTPQPLSIPENIYVEGFGKVTITEIANNVFYNTFIGDEYGSYTATGNSLNNNISSLTIPSTITTLGINAFGFDMSDNFVITCNAKMPPTIQWAEVQTSNSVYYQTAFGDYSSGDPGNYGGEYKTNENGENVSTYLYVPASSLTAYKEANFWKHFYRRVADPGSMIVYNGDGDWFNDKANWSNGEGPADDEIVIINGNVEVSTDVTIKDITINKGCSLTIVDGGIFHLNGAVTNNSENIITIEDGGQLYYNGEDELTVTVEKTIKGYGDNDNKDGWYTISSPVYSVEDMDTYGDAPYYYVAINDVTNLIPTNHNYDLYRYYEPGKTMEVGWWENYKEGEQLDKMLPDFTILSNGRGYLYASSEEVNLEFTGKVLTGSITHHCYKSYKTNENKDFNGFNLMGNPFTHDITLANVTGLEMASGFYTVTNAGTWESHFSTDNIKPTQGMLIKITDNTSIDEFGLGFITIAEEITKSRSNNNGSINIVVSNDKYSDNAIVSFSEGKGLNKFPHLNKEAHEVYVIDNETKYGVATMNDDVTTIPVGFKANTMGEYTIAVKAQDCKFNSMTLTDKMTGVKTNLLTDSYTFIATTNDNPDRFTLTLNADTNADFIYINNNEMIINNIEGDGLVQIYDVMGRSVATYNVSGSANISMEALSEGIYIVRMTDANGVKTQKVVNN